MQGSASVPVVGSAFEALNPRMDSQRTEPVPVYVVGGLSYSSIGEAERAASVQSDLQEKPIDIQVGSVPLADLQVLRTVQPPVQPIDPVAYVPTASETAGNYFETARPGKGSLSSSVSLPELSGPVEYIAKTDPQTIERDSFVPMDRPAWHALPICGLVTISVDKWEPKSRSSIPPSPTTTMGMALSAQFAIAYNQSEFARQRRRWCVVTNRGTTLVLTGIPEAQRPLNPCDFPPCVQQGMTFPDVERIADEQNAERYKVARVPRNWTVALRRADQVMDTPIDTVKGGGGVPC